MACGAFFSNRDDGGSRDCSGGAEDEKDLRMKESLSKAAHSSSDG